jgi:hypothetical protein
LGLLFTTDSIWRQKLSPEVYKTDTFLLGIYGRQATLPIQLDIPVQSQHEDGSTEEDQLASRIQSFTGLLRTQGVVKESIMKAQEMQKMYHDRNNIKPLYPGQLVLVKNTKRMNRKVEWSK